MRTYVFLNTQIYSALYRYFLALWLSSYWLLLEGWVLDFSILSQSLWYKKESSCVLYCLEKDFQALVSSESQSLVLNRIRSKVKLLTLAVNRQSWSTRLVISLLLPKMRESVPKRVGRTSTNSECQIRNTTNRHPTANCTDNRFSDIFL